MDAFWDTQLEHGCSATIRSAFLWCPAGAARFHCGHWGWAWSCACIPGNPPAPVGKALLGALAVLPCDKTSAGTCQRAPSGIIVGAVSRGSFKCHFPALITRDGKSNGMEQFCSPSTCQCCSFPPVLAPVDLLVLAGVLSISGGLPPHAWRVLGQLSFP